MAKKLTDAGIWQQDWYGILSTEHKLFCKYIFDKCDLVGVYKHEARTAKFEVGFDVDFEDFLQNVNNGKQRIKKISDNKFWIIEHLSFQNGLNISKLAPNLQKGIINQIERQKLQVSDFEEFEYIFSKGSPRVALPLARGTYKGKGISKGKSKGKSNSNSNSKLDNTNTSTTETNSKKEKVEKEKKDGYGKSQLVQLSEKQFDKLAKDLEEQPLILDQTALDWCIDKLDAWLDSKIGKEREKRLQQDHNRMLRGWVLDEWMLRVKKFGNKQQSGTNGFKPENTESRYERNRRIAMQALIPQKHTS